MEFRADGKLRQSGRVEDQIRMKDAIKIVKMSGLPNELREAKRGVSSSEPKGIFESDASLFVRDPV